MLLQTITQFHNSKKKIVEKFFIRSGVRAAKLFKTHFSIINAKPEGGFVIRIFTYSAAAISQNQKNPYPKISLSNLFLVGLTVGDFLRKYKKVVMSGFSSASQNQIILHLGRIGN